MFRAQACTCTMSSPAGILKEAEPKDATPLSWHRTDEEALRDCLAVGLRVINSRDPSPSLSLISNRRRVRRRARPATPVTEPARRHAGRGLVTGILQISAVRTKRRQLIRAGAAVQPSEASVAGPARQATGSRIRIGLTTGAHVPAPHRQHRAAPSPHACESPVVRHGVSSTSAC
jgi:hypothetical protein